MAAISNGLRARGIGTGAKLVGDAAVGDVRAAKIFMNASGEAVGTLPVRDGGGPVAVTPGINGLSLLAGIYDNTISIAGDADLVTANIKAGVNLFGVLGSPTVVDTSTGDAVAANILSGKKAYVNGALVTGNIASKGAATITPSTVDQVIAAGQFLSGAQTVAGDADLIGTNIKAGANIFGVAGNPAVVDTSDATMPDATYLYPGVTVYKNGSKITGTMPTRGNPSANPGLVVASLPYGYYDGVTIPAIATGSQIYSTVGSYSFNVPSGVRKVFVIVTGGGGGGSSRYSDASGGGGAGGRHIQAVDVTPGANVAVTVGGGGAGGLAGAANPGTIGNNSAFGSIIAYGGARGMQYSGGAGGAGGGYGTNGLSGVPKVGGVYGKGGVGFDGIGSGGNGGDDASAGAGYPGGVGRVNIIW